jgi:hypothetical protein
MALHIAGCVHDSKYNRPRVFHPLINNGINHHLVNFTFILLPLSTVKYPGEVHQSEWLISVMADLDREDVARKSRNRCRNSITSDGMGTRSNSQKNGDSLDPFLETVKTIQFSSNGCWGKAVLRCGWTWTRIPSSPSCLDGRKLILGISCQLSEFPSVLEDSYCVANRVHVVEALGNGMRLMASKTERLPDNCSPQTTSCGSSSSCSTSNTRSSLIKSRILVSFSKGLRKSELLSITPFDQLPFV